MPESAQPPTPSATAKNCFDAYTASSPPFYYFYGCGIIDQLLEYLLTNHLLSSASKI